MTPTDPPALDDLARRGCTMLGSPVTRLVVRLLDGRRVAVEMPEPGSGDGELNDTQRNILAILRASAVPMKRSAVAKRMGRSDAKGSFGAGFRDLLARKLIRREGGGYVAVESRPAGVVITSPKQATRGLFDGDE